MQLLSGKRRVATAAGGVPWSTRYDYRAPAANDGACWEIVAYHVRDNYKD
jgi:hypothetical protein